MTNSRVSVTTSAPKEEEIPKGTYNRKKIKHMQGYWSYTVALKKYFFTTTIVSARPQPEELFPVVRSLIHTNHPGEVGEDSVV